MKSKACERCGRDMYRQWAGAKFGRKVLCLMCNRLGFFFDGSGLVHHKEVPPESWPA